MAKSWEDEIVLAIPSINGGRLLARMLPTIQFKLANVVVLDQGSTDETAEVCAQYGVNLVQLGFPHTYTQACNIGARLAEERGCKYVCVSNNDLIFRNNVLLDLFTEMERDPKLGILAPGQIIIDEDRKIQTLTTRVFWNLSTVDFMHDIAPIEDGVLRLESDFCELTCALVRISAISEIGFLDDQYGFYHEDADFGFRLRQSGYECAYLPRTQIEHFHGTTFRQDKIDRRNSYMWKNKLYFAKKHLGFGVNHVPHGVYLGNSQEFLSANLHSYLHRFGMINTNAPDLLMGYPGVEFSDYLYTDLNTDRVPGRWASFDRKYRAIFTTSERMKLELSKIGIKNTYHVPAGIEPDFFHIWGPRVRPYDETTYLALIDGGSDPTLPRIIAAWRKFSSYNKARLIVLGKDLGDCLGRAPDSVYRSDNIDIEKYRNERVDVYRMLAPLDSPPLARIFRSVDYVILGSAGETSLTALGALASGLPFILANSSAGSAHEGLSADDLVEELEKTLRLNDRERAILSRTASDQVRGRSTLRHTAMGVHQALSQLQTRDPSLLLSTLDKRRPQTIPTHLLDQSLTSPEAAALPAAAGIKPASLLRLRGARILQAVAYLMNQFAVVWRDRGLRLAIQLTAGRVKRLIRRSAHRLGLGKSVARLNAPLPLSAALPRVIPRSALLIGYIDAQLGLGQSLRGLALAMSRGETNFAIYPFAVGVEGRRMAPYMPERYDQTNAHAVNIIEVTPDELPTVFTHVSKRHFNRSYNILRTYWELSEAPELWRSRLSNIDEIWAPSTFIAESFRAVFGGPITCVPPCVDLHASEPRRGYFGLSDNRIYFLYSFDYFSFPERKNPLGVLNAFRLAFPDASEPVGLIIKASGAPHHSPKLRDDLRSAARNDARIQVIDESLDRQDMVALMATADCYVSLHRSEGFGLGMAESMALKKPVIATNYSGNTDFLTDDTGYPIPYTLQPVKVGEYVHIENQVWAYPDEEACAAAMRSVVDDPVKAACKAAAGQRLVIEKFGYAAVGAIVDRRLAKVFDSSEGGR